MLSMPTALQNNPSQVQNLGGLQECDLTGAGNRSSARNNAITGEVRRHGGDQRHGGEGQDDHGVTPGMSRAMSLCHGRRHRLTDGFIL